jgi:hypothetical protein
VKIRPEAQEKLREGFQRKAERQRRLYAGQLAEAEQLGARFGCGEVVGIFSTGTPDPADWEPSRPLLTAYELHLADGQARFVSLSYRNMLDPYPAIGREMRSLAPAALAVTWPKLPLIKEIILACAGRPDPAGEER